MDIQYLLFLQQINDASGGLLRQIAAFLSELGASAIPLIIIANVYWCLDKKLGTRIAFACSFGGVLNQTLKNSFCINRPWVRDSRLKISSAIMAKAGGYSFPSGHSQNAVDIYGNIALRKKFQDQSETVDSKSLGTASMKSDSKKDFLTILAVILVFLIPFSRNLLGVHTPQDVITGMLVGAFSLFTVRKAEQWLPKNSNGDLIFLAIGTILVILHLLYVSLRPYETSYQSDGTLLVDPVLMVKDCYSNAGMFLGILIGWVLERRKLNFTTESDRKTRGLRGVLGTLTVLIIYLAGLKIIDDLPVWPGTFFHLFILFLYIVFIYPMIFTAVEKRHFSSGY